jgi:proline dehydrogenase
VNPSLRKALDPVRRPIVEWAGRAYLAGPELEDALRVCRRLAGQGVATTVCYWNALDDSPDRVAREYQNALGALAAENLDSYLSVKSEALGFSAELVRALVERGRQTGIRIHFDALAPETADETFSLIADAHNLGAELGCTLPGRWRRSLADADRAAELGLSVRVVKGQWIDPEEPSLHLRRGYLAVVDRLAGRARHVAVASHDSRLIREALRRLTSAGTSCELELVLGLPRTRQLQVAREAGVRARVYVPYGHFALPYSLSQVRHRPRILWWLVRGLALGRSSDPARDTDRSGRRGRR